MAEPLVKEWVESVLPSSSNVTALAVALAYDTGSGAFRGVEDSSISDVLSVYHLTSLIAMLEIVSDFD